MEPLELTDATLFPEVAAPKKIHQMIPRLITLLRLLTHPYAVVGIVPVLAYNIFIYIYLGILEQGTDFYRGFGLQYSLFYSAIAVGYWNIWIQSQKLKDSSHIIINELFDSTSFTNPPCDCTSCPTPLWCLTHSTHFRLVKTNLDYLYSLNSQDHPGAASRRPLRASASPYGYNRFEKYCIWWETRIAWIFGVWSTVISIHVIIKALPKSFLNLPENFDSRPIAFYGFFNLFSQYIAMIIIVTGGITMLIGFYQLRFIIVEFSKKMRTHFMMSRNPPNHQV